MFKVVQGNVEGTISMQVKMPEQWGKETLLQANEAPHTELGAELVFLSVENGKYYSLKGTARRIWELLSTPTKLGALIDVLSDEYGIDEERCSAETVPFLGKLIEAGLVNTDLKRATAHT